MPRFDDLTERQQRAATILNDSYHHHNEYRRRLARQKLRELLNPQFAPETRIVDIEYTPAEVHIISQVNSQLRSRGPRWHNSSRK